MHQEEIDVAGLHTATYTQRKFGTKTSASISKQKPRETASASLKFEKSTIQVPEGLEEIGGVLNQLKDSLKAVGNVHSDDTEMLARDNLRIRTPQDQEYEEMFEVGAVLKIKWDADEIGDSGWRPGWYTADVQMADLDNDTVEVEYRSEQGCIYKIQVTPMLSKGKLLLKKAVF
eukprot:Seg24649.1 transcript_id=Seg24649.1/GoldUCD/mRNA.D3Y31 product="hypothetical protein" protein_id=Seg24649.1/GoldUCD/D3Y31